MAALLAFLVIILLVLVNGLFVAAEFSIIGVRPSRIEQLAQEGNRAARWVHQVLSDRTRTDSYIATAQLGITLASLGLGMYAEPAIAHLVEPPLQRWFSLEEGAIHTLSFLLALTLITYLHVVVGEMVPKSMALQNAERTVLFLTNPMRVMGRVFGLAIRGLNRIGLWTLKILRVPTPGHGSRLYSLDELELIVTESHAGGLLEGREHELVANILDFGQERVVQVMTPRPMMLAVPVTISEEELLALYDDIPFSRLPVFGEDIDDVLGILHLKDLVRQQISGEPYDLRALLRQVPFVPETLPINTMLASFRAQHQQLAIVIDEHGGTLGLVTLEDLLEEVVGEVRDEFDLEEEDPIVVVEPGHLRVQGTVQIEEVAEVAPLGHHDYAVHTIGGLVLSELGRRPEVGDTVTLGPVTLRVEGMEGLSITRVSVHYPI
jgi:CBS domain containing-hemolysin-like protein